MLGNLGRAGYGATLEGTWPYACEFSKLSFALHHHALLIAEKLADRVLLSSSAADDSCDIVSFPMMIHFLYFALTDLLRTCRALSPTKRTPKRVDPLYERRLSAVPFPE